MRTIAYLPRFFAIVTLLALVHVLFINKVQAQGFEYIDAGQTLHGTLSNGAGDHWTYYSNGDETITVSMESRQLDAYLEIFDQNWNSVCSDDDRGGNANAWLTCYLPFAGEYIIVASDYYRARGAYTLTLISLTEVNCGTEGWTIGYGSTVNGQVYCNAGTQWSFIGATNDIVSARMISQSFDTDLEIYNPNGQLICSDDDSGIDANAYITNCVLRQNGLYQLLAKGYAITSGSYTLELDGCNRPPTSIRPTLMPPQSDPRGEVESLLAMWDVIHHEVDRTLDATDLPLVLTGDALWEQQEALRDLRSSNCYWNFVDLDSPVVFRWEEVSERDAYVSMRKHWDGKLYCNGQLNRTASFNQPFSIRYHVIHTRNGWRIESKETL